MGILVVTPALEPVKNWMELNIGWYLDRILFIAIIDQQLGGIYTEFYLLASVQNW